MSNQALSVDDVVVATISLNPANAQLKNFGVAAVLGDSDVIDVTQRFRIYTSLTSVGLDFGTQAPEYVAAGKLFSQGVAQVIVARWARTATHGALEGGVLSASAQTLANFTSVTNGGMVISVDGTQYTLSALNFSTAGNLNAVASTVQTALGGAATVVWEANLSQFLIKSSSTGALSAVSFASPPVSGVDVSNLMGLNMADGGYVVAGIAAETALQAAQNLYATTSAFYGLGFASSVMPSISDYTAVAGFIEASGLNFWVTSSDPNMLNAQSAADIGSILKAANYQRSWVQYSSTDPYAALGSAGIAYVVNFQGVNTTITMKFKTPAGVPAETLGETAESALKAKNINAVVTYNNGATFLQEGVMANGTFYDVIQGADWLQNAVQTDVLNELLDLPKVPQTDAGVNDLIGVVVLDLEQAVTNGLCAPGVWTGKPVGALATGQTMTTGYYIYAPPIATQSVSARNARQAPVMTACVKLAGAFHSANVALNFNS